MFTLVFGKMGLFYGRITPALFYITGITAWNYFADVLPKLLRIKIMQTFLAKYISTTYMPLSIVVSNLVRFGVHFYFALVMAFYAVNGARSSNMGH
jgi:lipopolysaccharide transport system permease protein